MISFEKKIRPSGNKNQRWINLLGRVNNELYILNKNIEEEFTQIGSHLAKFSNHAGEISSKSVETTQFMSGEDILVAIDNLRVILDQIDEAMNGSEVNLKRRTEILSNIQKIIGSIFSNLEMFKKFMKKLGIFSISTKIESARLGNEEAGFIVLADDVEKLSALIMSKSSDISLQLDALNKMIHQAFLKVFTLRDKQFSKARMIMDGMRKTIQVLTEMHAHSKNMAESILGQSDKISQNINEVVASIQFHDITRQQMDKINEDIKAICNELGNDTVEKGSEAGNNIARLCLKNKAQLNQIKSEVINATSTIIFNLEGICNNAFDLSRESGDVSGNTGRSGSTILSDMESGMAALNSFLAENIRITQDMSTAMSSVASTVNNMSAFVHDIDDISLKIEVIAINSLIKAAHTGEEGAPLSVLAQAIQKLSLDARSQTDSISGILNDITISADELNSGIDNETEKKRKETDAMIVDLDLLIKSIRNMNSEITFSLGQLNDSSLKLGNKIKREVIHIKVQEKVSAIIGKINHDLEEVILHFQKNGLSADDIPAESFLPAAQSATESRPAEEHYKDNIELF